jgi:hypothetical protein
MARKSKQQVMVEDLDRRKYEAEVKLLEAVTSYYDNVVDPLDALRDDDTGELWPMIGAPNTGSESKVGLACSEGELAAIRRECRLLAVQNPFAINGHENRVSYIVGTGHTYTAAARKGEEVAPELLQEVQVVVDEFIEENGWHKRQQEIMRRRDRDGECFLRFFADPSGLIRVRFVEPIEVSQPTSGGEKDTFGIRTDPDDVETVLGYWVNGTLVDAAEIQHRKVNVDCNVKRGLPTFYPVRKNLRRAEKLLRNMTVVAEIQTAIALIRKHKGGTAAGIQAWAQGRAEASTTNQITGETRYHKHYAPGTVLDVAGETEYDFPAQGIDGGRYVVILQAELRAIASRLCMPEFMLSSDASNANYSSTMVAEGPAVKTFQRLQWEMIEDDLKIMDRVLDKAVEAGRLSQDIREAVTIDATPPNVASRKRTEEVSADVALVSARIMSVRTAQLHNDLDPETEDANIEAENERSIARNPFAGLANGEDQGDGDGDDDTDDGPSQPATEADAGAWVTINGAHVLIGKGSAKTSGAPMHNIQLPKDRKRLSIDQAHDAMKQMGYKEVAGSHEFDNTTGASMVYHIPGGGTKRLTSAQVRDLVYKGAQAYQDAPGD